MSAIQALPHTELASTWTDVPRRKAYVLRGSWVIIDQGIVSLANFFAAAIVGRVCGREEMGIYGLAVSIFWLVAAIPNSLVWTPYTSTAAKLPRRRRAIYAGSVTFHAGLVTVSIAAVLLVLGLVSPQLDGNAAWFGPMCLALVPFVIFTILREHVRRINLAHLQTRALLAVDVPAALLQIGLLLALAHFGMLSATTALLAAAAASGVALVWMFNQREQFQFHAARVRTHWTYNQRFGGWVLLVSLAWVVGDTSYRWLLGSLRGMEALGEFTAAQSVVLAVNPFLLAISNLARATTANTIARSGTGDLWRTTTRATLMLGLSAGAALSVLALLGGPVVRMVFGPEFGGQSAIVAALCLGMFAHSLLVPVDAVLAALQRGRALLVASVARMIVIIAASVPLIWWRGAEGVGYSIALGCAAAAIVQWLALARETGDENQPAIPMSRRPLPEGASL